MFFDLPLRIKALRRKNACRRKDSKKPRASRGFLLSLDGITIYNLWKVVIANCENESYNLLKGPSIPAFTYRDGCLFDLSIPSEDDMGTMACGWPIESDIRSQ